jgi:hypothetical protein
VILVQRKSLALFTIAFAALLVSTYLACWRPKQGAAGAQENLRERVEGSVRQLKVEASVYKWEQARKNLESIGRLVQIERQKTKLKPQAEWKSAPDTGLTGVALQRIVSALPENVRFVEGRVWPPPDIMQRGKILTQYKVIYNGMTDVLDEKEMDSVWSLRGEELPIIMDDAMYSPQHVARAEGRVKVLVLRLNGRVDEVYIECGLPYDSPKRKDIFKEL